MLKKTRRTRKIHPNPKLPDRQLIISMEEGWVIAYTTNEMYLAELFKRVLGDNDIESVIINKIDSVYQTFGDIEVYVRQDQILRAKKLAEEFNS